ncbi:hydrogenase expression protein [Spirochaetia bacterium]|nr:hydrogenase expression protein [Spirochaetia bacterium]
MKKHTMFLLWVGAAISISEIYTGGTMASLGYGRGIAAILIGHLIGTGLLALGGYISFTRKENAMDSVAFSLGRGGGRLVAVFNVVQLIGWTIIMVVQAGSAAVGALPEIPFQWAALVLSVLVLAWALIMGSPAARLNEIVVILLSILCAVLFVEARGNGSSPFAGLSENMSMTLGIELSIAMPVSWLPLAGDYACKAESKTGAAGMPFAGYFIGSVLMYCFGLFIGISTGGDIFTFIAGSRLRFLACAVVLFSTLTTAFLDLYSAAVSSRQLVKTKTERMPVLVIGLFTVLAAVLFPITRYEEILINFLSAIGMVFVPVYSVLFLEFFFRRGRWEKTFQLYALLTIFVGMAGYRFFTQYEIWIPTVMSIILVSVLYVPFLLVRSSKKV